MEVLHELLDTDYNVVISAPTGSGKTAMLEFAIVRSLVLSEKQKPLILYRKLVYYILKC